MMNIERRSLLNNQLGLVGAVMAAKAGIEAVYIANTNITVLRRQDGSYSMKNHLTGKEPNKATRQQIIKEIKERKL